MKTPHLLTSALVAAAAMMGGSQSISPQATLTLKPAWPLGNMFSAPTIRTARRARGRVAQNQRQRRKDARRSFSAGARNAFA